MNRLRNVFNSTFFVVFFAVTVIAVTTVIKDCFWAGLWVFPLMLLVLRSKKSAPTEVKKHLWPILQLISTGVMVFLVLKLEVYFSWDWGDLIRSAYECAKGEEITLMEYFARYPNNRFWLTVLTGLFKVILLFAKGASVGACKKVTIFISIAMVQLTIFIIYKTAQLIWSPGKALIAGCVALVFLPFYLYAQFFYTDIPAMFLIACVVYLYLHYKKSANSKRKVYLLAAIGALSGLIYQVKIMGMVVPIAIIIDLFLSIESLKKAKEHLIRFVALALAFVCCVFATNVVTDKTIPISDELYQKYEFPYAHWVMMGLGKTGGYRQVDVDYSISFGTYDEKAEANIAEIKNRISERGALGTAEHLLFTKTARTWGNDHLNGADYVHRYTRDADGWVYDVFTLDGDKAVIRDIYTGIYHVFMIVGIFLAAVFAAKNKQWDSLLFVRIAIFGIFIFLTIWECNSRYLLIISPLLLLSSCDGWFRGIRYFRKSQFKRS